MPFYRHHRRGPRYRVSALTHLPIQALAPALSAAPSRRHSAPDGSSIGLYSAERTLIDLFRLRHVWGSDLALGALKQWLRKRGNSPGSLLTMADDFPKARPAIQQTLEVLL